MSQQSSIQKSRILSRVDTETNWINNNPVLLDKEIGYERETGKYKIGKLDENGQPMRWNDLSYAASGGGNIEIDDEIINQIIEEVETNSGFITNSNNAFTNYDNIVKRKAFKLTNIEHTDTACVLTLKEDFSSEQCEDVPGGYYADLNKDFDQYETHTISISATETFIGIENCTITVSGNKMNVSVNGADPFPSSLVINSYADNEATGKIRNILMFDDHPLWGNIELENSGSFASGNLNICGIRHCTALGQDNRALGEDSICVGWENKAGYYCGAFGQQNKSLGHSSFAFGRKNTLMDTTNESMFAAGTSNTIYAGNGITFGNSNTIHEKANSSLCVGSRNHTYGKNSLAGGSSCVSYGHHSFAYGQGNIALGAYTVTLGRLAITNQNVKDNAINGEGTYAFAFGNGTYNDPNDDNNVTRSNALAFDWEGNLELGGQTISLKSPDGTRFKIKVSNDGTLITERVEVE